MRHEEPVLSRGVYAVQGLSSVLESEDDGAGCDGQAKPS